MIRTLYSKLGLKSPAAWAEIPGPMDLRDPTITMTNVALLKLAAIFQAVITEP